MQPLTVQEINELLPEIQNKVQRVQSNYKSKSINFPLFVRVYLDRVGEACTWDIYTAYNILCEAIQYKKIQYGSACRYMYILNREGLVEKTRKEKSDKGKWDKQLYRVRNGNSSGWSDVTIWRA
jgi:hypothetical protein